MLSKNNMLAGLLAGSVLPIIVWLIFGYYLHNDAIIMDKPAVPYLIAIALNLLMLRYCFKNGLDKTASGVMMVTFAVMLAVFIFKIHIG